VINKKVKINITCDGKNCYEHITSLEIEQKDREKETIIRSLFRVEKFRRDLFNKGGVLWSVRDEKRGIEKQRILCRKCSDATWEKFKNYASKGGSHIDILEEIL
jgi:hypothetical protein